MPMSHILSCDRCGNQWRWLQLKKTEPLPACPNPRCGQSEVTKELAAPNVSRDAAPETRFAVPQTRAGREKFAYEMAEGMGFTNMKDNLREGESAAPKVADPEITAPNGRKIKVGAQFAQVSGNSEQIHSQIAGLVGGAGGAQVNRHALNVLGGMKRH